MLYRATIGDSLPTNPEMAAFIKGFELECRNGFKLTKVNFQLAYLTLNLLQMFNSY